MTRWLRGALMGSAVAALAYWRQALTVDGAVAAAGLGCVVWARGGWSAAITLMSFFVSSSALSKIGEAYKQAASLVQEKGARRDAWQVAANGGLAGLALVVGGDSGRAAYVGALAAAAADTWATEIGLLARGTPRLITTGAVVAPGTSGGVTAAGLGASAAAAMMVAVIWRTIGQSRPHPLGVIAAGFSGSLIDSVLGATVQAAYVCPQCNHVTESTVHPTCGTRTRLTRGCAWATNDTVNALATLSGALVAAAVPRKR